MMKLRVDYKLCARSGQCFYMYPELMKNMKKGERDLPQPRFPEVPETLRAQAEELVDICPVGAIQLKSD